MQEHSAAADAKTLLHGAARQLNTQDPVPTLGSVLDESLPRPPGDDAYSRQRSFEPRFAETAAGSLAFDLLPGGPGASPSDRLLQATDTVRALTSRSFGSRALRWLDGRLDGAVQAGGPGGRRGAARGSRLPAGGGGRAAGPPP